MFLRLFLLTVFIFSSLFAQTQIAVVEFQANGVSQIEARALTDRLVLELFKTGEFTVLEREMLDKIIDEQKFQLSGCTSTECLIEIGRLANVQEIIAGSVSHVGSTYSISARLISIETGKIIRIASHDQRGEIDDLLTSGMKNIAIQLSLGTVDNTAESYKQNASKDLASKQENINNSGIPQTVERLAHSGPRLNISISDKKFNRSENDLKGGGGTYSPGDTILYTITATNVGDAIMTNPVITDPLPGGVSFIANSEEGDNAEIVFSIDGGNSYAPWPMYYSVRDSRGIITRKEARADMVTHIRWIIQENLEAGEFNISKFKVVVNP